MLELEQGVGSVECNKLVVGLMRNALFAQAQAAQARQLQSLGLLMDGLQTLASLQSETASEPVAVHHDA